METVLFKYYIYKIHYLYLLLAIVNSSFLDVFTKLFRKILCNSIVYNVYIIFFHFRNLFVIQKKISKKLIIVLSNETTDEIRDQELKERYGQLINKKQKLRDLENILKNHPDK